jgi:hypothetical protein
MLESMEPNERGTYGDRKESGSVLSVAIVVGLAAAIYGLSPGARHWYKHGRLPNGHDGDHR